MVEIHLKLDQGVPQYACSSCCSCSSVFGKSLCSITNRGCCWYYSKFTLHEIHKMAKSSEGLETLKNILSFPQVKVYNYYIHAKGYFDETGYRDYLKSEQAYEDDVNDKTIFFRTCLFVSPGVGCTLPEKYRSYVCNFFICDPIVKEVEKYDLYKNYIKERNSYVKWIEWENYSLETLLKDKGLNLLSNFDEIINILKDYPLDDYEFPSLPSIETEDQYSIGA